jgi:hemoglobin
MSQPAKTEQQISPYDYMGGEAEVRAMVERFYDLMETDPAYAELRAMHAPDLKPMRERLFQFFSGWLGGPRLYSSCVMSAHAPFAIGTRERDQWLACMARAMEEAQVPEAVRALVTPAFERMSQGMQSR